MFWGSLQKVAEGRRKVRKMLSFKWHWTTSDYFPPLFKTFRQPYYLANEVLRIYLSRVFTVKSCIKVAPVFMGDVFLFEKENRIAGKLLAFRSVIKAWRFNAKKLILLLSFI